MARISCYECDKPFKNKTGLAWHLKHTNQLILDSLDENSDAFIHGGDAGIEALQSRLEYLESDVDQLRQMNASLNSLSDLRDRVGGIEELVKDFREALKKKQKEHRFRDQAVDHQLADA